VATRGAVPQEDQDSSLKILFTSHISTQYIKDRDPLGIMSLIATVKRAGHEVYCCFPGMGPIEDALHQFPARLIAYSVSTGIHNYYLKVNETVKRRHKDIISVFGGPHLTFSPDFIEQSDSIDAICRGEGDIAFVDFLDKIEKRADYHLSRNFYVRIENRIYKNELMDLIDNLDDLPYPDRENVYEAFPSARDIRIKNFMTMRGCPHITARIVSITNTTSCTRARGKCFGEEAWDM